MERLQKLLSRAGVASRRASETLISDGRVSVDGEVVTELGTKADPAHSEIAVDGKPIRMPDGLHVLLLNKPTGVLSTRSDDRGRRTVMSFVPEAIRDLVYPVGRLDFNSTGLLLLTSDGALTFRLTHPSYHIPKTYIVQVNQSSTPEQLAALADGVLLEDGMTAPAQVSLVDGHPRRVKIVLHEGRKRQIRRMVEAVGNDVTALHRVAVGPLELGDLPLGDIRELSAAETGELRKAVSLMP